MDSTEHVTTETIPQNVRITTQQRWLIRASWPKLEFYVSKRGFGDFAKLKELIGAPTVSKDDHHDYDAKNATSNSAFASGEFRKLASEIAPQHLLTVIFYDHLFGNNPQMKEIFWRFNLWQTMTKITEVMDPQLDLHQSIKALAERHRGRGIQNEDYDKIGISFVAALEEFRKQGEDKKKSRDQHVVTSEGHNESSDMPPIDFMSDKIVQAWGTAWDLFADAMKVKEEVENKSSEPVQQHEPEQVKEYTIDEVSIHNSAQDLWLVVDNKVYDLTKFYPRHPGGEMMLLGAGKDATQLFLKNFHSKRAQAILAKYFIGNLK